MVPWKTIFLCKRGVLHFDVCSKQYTTSGPPPPQPFAFSSTPGRPPSRQLGNESEEARKSQPRRGGQGPLTIGGSGQKKATDQTKVHGEENEEVEHDHGTLP